MNHHNHHEAQTRTLEMRPGEEASIEPIPNAEAGNGGIADALAGMTLEVDPTPQHISPVQAPLSDDAEVIEDEGKVAVPRPIEEILPPELARQLAQYQQMMARLTPEQRAAVARNAQHRMDNTHEVFGRRVYVKRRTSKTRRKK